MAVVSQSKTGVWAAMLWRLFKEGIRRNDAIKTRMPQKPVSGVGKGGEVRRQIAGCTVVY